MHLIEANGKRILFDCGLYQGRRKESFHKNRDMQIDPKSIDAVILSHAHIDHCGNLPTLARNGFRGKVYSTPATHELCEILLRDSAYLQSRDLEYVNKKRARQNKTLFDPLYEEPDVAQIIRQFQPELHKRQVDLGDGVTFMFHNAGHILGSAIVQLDVTESGERSRRLLFTGDLGQPNQVILRDYDMPQGADILMIESTYADRDHSSAGDVMGHLQTLVNEMHQRKSTLIIPAFSVGRTQQILYFLDRLLDDNLIPSTDVYVDSPLSLKATKIYTKHRECYDEEASDLLREGKDPVKFPGLKFIQSVDESKALNDAKEPMIIIAASGMCEGGRVLHHLKYCISDPDNIILMVGYCAENTLGRRITDKVDPIKIFGDEYPLRADVHQIDALSAHADRTALMSWFDNIKGNLSHAFAVHGEIEKVTAMQQLIREHGLDTVDAPAPGDVFTNV